ncbi:ImmA/IrrE family metallo-endopeptidase [Micromonospora aurantiaca (nom. illeg.)]|uniref:ImmA/IrrE family metallo-endopeptidase n=1 Tax=Micromonospora aurantiaca (nom. illeg.) TaxID=47850 RepID=UPI000827F64D|nr:XRE family transcriptional regulator [Micromonospora aurantiaca]SCL40126.1 Zn-dependent peptidase ImmA, M78 family [Micromonospora aurantiaca]
MPAVKMSINPTMLAWAMQQAGVSAEQLARDLDVKPELLNEWLNGDSQPGTGQLRDIAKELHRPTSLFFLPRPPATTVSPTAFRSPIGNAGERRLSRNELDEIRKATRRQKVVFWAQKQLEAVDRVELPAYSSDVEEVARAARKWLGWRMDEQLRATSKSAVTKALRAALEERGFIVLQLSMGDDHCRGFSIAHLSVPLIAYNTKGQVAAARSFTILHELGHLIKNEQAVCEKPNDATERWCDEFAAAFLMPPRHLETYVRVRVGRGRTRIDDDDLDAIRLISNRFKASYQCVALRLIKLGWASWKLYELVRTPGAEVDQGFSRERQTTSVVRLREYGSTYARTLLAARQRGLLSETDTRKYLDVNGEQLRSLERRLENVG